MDSIIMMVIYALLRRLSSSAFLDAGLVIGVYMIASLTIVLPISVISIGRISRLTMRSKLGRALYIPVIGFALIELVFPECVRLFSIHP